MKNILFTVSFVFAVFVSQAQEMAMTDYNMASKASSLEEDPNEGKIPLGDQEIPEAVITAFKSSLFQHMEIVQVFLIQDEALNQVISETTEDNPELLYEFTLRVGGKSFVQYFTAQGELYEQNRSA